MSLSKRLIVCLFFALAAGLLFSGSRSNTALADQSTAVATSAATVSPEATAAATPADPVEFEFKGADDFVLPALEYQAVKSPAPAVLLLHERGGNKEEWFPWAKKWAGLGVNIFAIDIRGYGHTKAKEEDPVKIDQDLQLVLQQINERPEVIPGQIGILGGSMGGGYAMVACASSDLCKTVILLSAAPYKGDLKDPVESLGKRPILMAVASLDSPFVENLRDFDKRAQGDHQLIVYEGSFHATVLLYKNPELVDTIGAWFVKYLVNAPVATGEATMVATVEATSGQ